MKVLYVINGLGTGGSERSLSELLPQLREVGIDSTVVCLQRRAAGVEAQLLADGFDIRFLSTRRLPASARDLRSVIQTVRPDVVHTTVFDADVVGRIASWRVGPPVMTSLVNTSYDPVRLHDPHVGRRAFVLAKAIDGWTARHLTTHFHAVTPTVKRASVEALRIPPDRITVVERGRDPVRLGTATADRRSRVRERMRIGQGQPVLLTAGRMEFQKGHEYLLRAVGQLRATHPDLLLLLAGRAGACTPRLEGIVRKERLEPHVRFLGHRDDVPDLMAMSDLFVLPSLYEGTAGAVIEAMALGLAVVASEIPTMRDVVVPEETADLVRAADGGALAAAIDKLLLDQTRRRRYGEAGRAVFEEKFTLSRSLSRMVELYERVAAREHVGSPRA